MHARRENHHCLRLHTIGHKNQFLKTHYSNTKILQGVDIQGVDIKELTFKELTFKELTFKELTSRSFRDKSGNKK